MPAAVDIKIKFDDGTILTAEGGDANSIWQWYLMAQTVAFVHGHDYKGPQLTKITDETKLK